MKRRVSLLLSVLLVIGAIWGGYPGMAVWADSAPDVPSGLTATAVSSSQINVSWSPVADATGYELVNADDNAQVLYDGTATSFNHTGLSANTSYRYQVRSYRVTDEVRYTSGLSGAVNATTDTVSVNPPGAPSGLTATAQSANTIRLIWTAGSGTIDGYYLERKMSGESWQRIQTITPGSTTSFDNTGLTAGLTYYYRIQAYNSGGSSPYSTEANATTHQLPVIPAKPSELKATNVLSDRVTLTWKDNSNNETGFRVFRSTGGNSYTQVGTVGANTTAYTDSGLTANTAYTYQVVAYNTGDSDPSNSVTITTLSTLPAKPTNLVASQVGTDRVTLTWKDNANNETGFKIERKTVNGNYSEIATVNANVVTFINSNLSNNTTYTYRVRAYNTAGSSDASNEATVTTASVPVKPDNLKISSTGTDRLTITWRDNANNEKGYRIERKPVNGTFSEIATVGANVTSYTNTGLSNNTTYTYRVRAFNDAGNSQYSNEISGKTGVSLAKPDTLEVSTISTDRVTITWKDRSSNETGFVIERKTENGSYSEIATVRANTTSYTDTRLRNNTTYTYRIQAYNNEGRSEFSEELKVTTGLVPDKPTELTITLVDTDRIRIEWKDNADNETGFRIERKTENGDFTEIATVRANVTSYTNTGLRNRTEYTYRVRAYNNTGNSAFSNEVKTVTGLVPEAPDRLTITSEEEDRISLSWRDRSENEKGFIVERKTGSRGFTKVATLSANTTTYTDRNLASGASYTYRVKAYNDVGESDSSNEVTARTAHEIVTKLTIGSTQYRVDGQLRTMDAAPIIYESRTLLPIRYVAEAIGATVLWDAADERVTVMLDDTVVELWIGSNIARVNGVRTQIDANNSQVKPLIIPPGRTMMPLAFISRSLGCEVTWNEATREVTVTYSDH